MATHLDHTPEKGAANGLATLDGSVLVPVAQLPAATTIAQGAVELATDGEVAAGVVVQGNDARLADARTPTNHAASHQNGGVDEVATATPAANAIPKAAGDGELVAGWLKSMVGDSGAGGVKGAVPAPATGDAAAHKYLDAGGAWTEPVDATSVAAAGAVMDSDFTPGEGFMRKTGAGTYTAVKSNLTGVAAPGAGNDSTQGYGVSSIWIDEVLNKVYSCADASVGAAVWIDQGNGAAGPVGMVWQGPWLDATGYVVNDVVENDDSSWICIQAHTSAPVTEPGVGASYTSVWELVSGGTGVVSVGGTAPIVSSGGVNPVISISTMVGATGGGAGASGSVPQPVAGQQGFLLLGNGVWTDPATIATGSAYQVASALDPIATSSLTDAPIPGLTLTPPAGTYLVVWGATISHNKSGQTAFGSVWVGGAQIAYTERQIGGQANNLGNASSQAIVTVNGSQAIEARWRVSSNSGGGMGSSPGPRSLTILKVA